MDIIRLAVLGLGSRTTSFYLKELNRLYNINKGGYSTCPFILLNSDFDTINSLLPNPSEALDLAMQQYINEIETLNSAYILIPNITLHETVDRLNIIKKVLHPVHLSIQKIKENKWGKVVLFGSLFSMKSEYISNQFKAKEIEVILPCEADMIFIDKVRKQIYNYSEAGDLIEKYHSIINKYAKNNPVILSCTELSILKSKENNNILDMAQVQIQEAVNFILN